MEMPWIHSSKAMHIFKLAVSCFLPRAFDLLLTWQVSSQESKNFANPKSKAEKFAGQVSIRSQILMPSVVL